VNSLSPTVKIRSEEHAKRKYNPIEANLPVCVFSTAPQSSDLDAPAYLPRLARMARWTPDAQRSRSTRIIFPDGLWQAARPLLSFHENACGVGTHDFGQRPFIKPWFIVEANLYAHHTGGCCVTGELKWY